ncbi:hypothetical protein MPEAHAMD_2879 [Methylobacterium frigidaeris]|uniref:Uncharacterized protein n=1 Tax=Methylobacterium frigidaeris TaxID=2038277 RepID=A0AA37HC01_9HYPH|nr:hypothetical protein MPEAHAMD_2879 [Methylobacterium frigidaeris]
MSGHRCVGTVPQDRRPRAAGSRSAPSGTGFDGAETSSTGPMSVHIALRRSGGRRPAGRRLGGLLDPCRGLDPCCGGRPCRSPGAGWACRARRPARTWPAGGAGRTRWAGLAPRSRRSRQAGLAGRSRHARGTGLAAQARFALRARLASRSRLSASPGRSGLATRTGGTGRTWGPGLASRTGLAARTRRADLAARTRWPGRPRQGRDVGPALGTCGALRAFRADGPLLAALAHHRAALLTAGAQGHDAGRRMIDEAELELPPGIGPGGEAGVEADLGLRLVGGTEHPELARGDPRRQDLDLGPGRRRGHQADGEGRTRS